MTSWIVSIIVGLLGVWWYFFEKKTPMELHGYCDSRFEKVYRMFRDMVQDDRDGASLAILWKGEVIAYLYGGYADRSGNKVWEANTMAIAYSTTKIWAGLISAILASRGLLCYDEKVSTFWPEFAKNGKHNTTVRDVLDHRAGLITFGREFGLQEATNSKTMSILIESAVPHWTPGSNRGYHALTYGFLVDEVVRRLDPKGRTVAQIYDEEIWEEGIDYYIGNRNLDDRLIARVSDPSVLESIIAYAKRPKMFFNVITSHIKRGGLAMKSANYPHFLSIMRKDSIPYNDPKVRALPSISCMGIGTALGFARAVEHVITRKLIADKIWNLLRAPTAIEEDIVLTNMKSFGHGFTYVQHPIKEEEWIIRVMGNGLQVAEVDKKEEVITVMLRNGLRAGEDGMQEFEDISRTIFQTITDA